MPRWLLNLFVLLIIISLPSFFALSSLYIFLSPSYVGYEYSKPDFPKALSFSDSERLSKSITSLEYVKGNRTFEEFKALGVYNDREIKHMVDVREVIAKVNSFYALDAALLVIALAALLLKAETRARAPRGLFWGGLLALALVGAIGLTVVLTFNTFFVTFHRIFFEGDTWLFLVTDSLIQFYPLPFWFDTSVGLVALTIVEAAIVSAAGWWWGRRISSKQ